MKREALSKKIMILGMDGMDPRFTNKMIREGRMPNTKKLIEAGSAREDLVLLGGHTTGTPPMWTTLACGCWPNVHGITDYYRYVDLDKQGYNLDSTNCKAEPVWNAFAEAGWKTLVWHWPGSSWPPTSDSPNLMVVDGSSPGGLGMAALQRGEEYIVGASVDVESVTYMPQMTGDVSAPCVVTGMVVSDNDADGSSVAERVSVGDMHLMIMSKKQSLAGVTSEAPTNVQISPIKDAEGWTNAPADAKEFILLTSEGLVRRPSLILKGEDGKYDRVAIYKSKKDAEPLVVLEPDVFTENIVDEVIFNDKTYLTNRSMRILELAEDGTNLRMYVSAAMDIQEDKVFHPHSLHDELIKNVGYIPPSTYIGAHNIELTNKCCHAIWDAVCDYQSAALDYMIQEHDVDIIFSHNHSIDMQVHQCIAFCKDKGEGDNKLPEEEYQRFMVNIYTQADRYIGKFLHYLDEGWTLILLSDHALVCPSHNPPMLCDASGVNIRVMQELGYTTLLTDENGKEIPEIDWSKTTAVANRACNIHINLKGRDPQGIVDPKDKYEFEEQLMTDLYGYRDPKTGKRVVALALRNKDAVLLGYGGKGTYPQCGDICYWLAEGYNWDHFDCLSTTWGEFETSISPIFVAAGTGIKKGYITDRMIREIDVAPTLAALGGVRFPAQCEGAPVYQILTEEI